jgi:hypothetical protein
MFGSQSYSSTHETEGNQARLDYYYSDANRRKKYFEFESNWIWYWEASASPLPDVLNSFCAINHNGNAGITSASNAGGVAPAFCVY